MVDEVKITEDIAGQPAQETTQQTDRPEWLPEKFKSAEELAKSYNELEKSYSETKQATTNDLNPFFNVPEIDKEELILDEVTLAESLECPKIIYALDKCAELYETPTFRAYKGIKSMIDKLAKYMEDTPIEHGRDGNINSLVSAAKNFDSIRQSFKGAYNDMKEEQKSTVRGGQGLAYDQL